MYKIIILFFIINDLVFGDINLYLTKTKDGDINATCFDTRSKIQSAIILKTTNHDVEIIPNGITTYWPYRQSNLNCKNLMCFDNPTFDNFKDRILRTNKFEVYSNRLCIIFPLKTTYEIYLYVTVERNNKNFTEKISTLTTGALKYVKAEFIFPDFNKSNVTLIFETRDYSYYRIPNFNDKVYIGDLQECTKDYRSINAILQPTTTNISCQKLNTSYSVSNTSIRSTSKCEPGYFGQYCDISCGDYFGKQHDHCKGVLMCGQDSCSCAAGYTGEYCQFIQKQLELQDAYVNNTIFYILIVLCIILILFLIITICLLTITYMKLKCTYKSVSIGVKQNETPVIHTNQLQGPEYHEGYSNKRSEINNVEVSQRSQNEPIISELKSIVHVVNKINEPKQFSRQHNEFPNLEEIKNGKELLENKSARQNGINEIKINSNLKHVGPGSHLKYFNVGVNVNSKGQPIYDAFLPPHQASENKYVYDYVEVQRNIVY